MGLFDKKYCDFCGNKIGLLGNRKFEDGNMCKDCASKLSPWFDGRRHSTKAELTAQLESREANRQAVAAFRTTRSLGKYVKLLIDDDNRKFMVTSASRLSEANPDVLTSARPRAATSTSARAGPSSNKKTRKASLSATTLRAMSIPTISMPRSASTTPTWTT